MLRDAQRCSLQRRTPQFAKLHTHSCCLLFLEQTPILHFLVEISTDICLQREQTSRRAGEWAVRLLVLTLTGSGCYRPLRVGELRE
jgi:hypothetical protein